MKKLLHIIATALLLTSMQAAAEYNNVAGSGGGEEQFQAELLSLRNDVASVVSTNAAGDILPGNHGSLGGPDRAWDEVYVGSNSLYLGGVRLRSLGDGILVGTNSAIAITPTGILQAGTTNVLLSVSTNRAVLIDRLEVKQQGWSSAGRGVVRNADLQVDNGEYGLILTATNGYSWLVWVNTQGALQTTQISASPEVSHAVRVQRMQLQAESDRARRHQWDGNSSVAERLRVVEQLIGLRQ